MKKNIGLEAFGKFLYQKRMERKIGLREMCRKVKFDPSNWSKIERGRMPPPSDEKTLSLWATVLGMKKNTEEYHSFVEYASIAQGIIPRTLSEKEILELMPAFFRTIRGGKPNKKELDALIEIIKKSA